MLRVTYSLVKLQSLVHLSREPVNQETALTVHPLRGEGRVGREGGGRGHSVAHGILEELHNQ